MQAEKARRILQEQIDQQTKKLSARSQKVAKERQELAGLRLLPKIAVPPARAGGPCKSRSVRLATPGCVAPRPARL
eukprot:2474448-Pleurochrysis_carterae.AAC.1